MSGRGRMGTRAPAGSNPSPSVSRCSRRSCRVRCLPHIFADGCDHSWETENCEPASSGLRTRSSHKCPKTSFKCAKRGWKVERHTGPRGTGTSFSVARISPASSMAPFINVPSARVSVGVREEVKVGAGGCGGRSFCLIISKLLPRP